jgi:hypothetical protein
MKSNMALRGSFNGLVTLGILAFTVGCQSTLKTEYNPTYTPTYSDIRKKTSVVIIAVTDRRSMKPAVYYQNSHNGDTGQFDKPVADIVREAVAAEIRRAGLTLLDQGGETALTCEVLDLKASITEPFLSSPILDLSVVVAFEWKNRQTNDLLAGNERSERRSRKLGMGNVPKLPLQEAVVKDYGNELINDMLPRVIEKEFHSASFLHPGQ